MKKIISLVGMLAAVVLLLASCSKENSSSIIGTWRLEKEATTTYRDGQIVDSHISPSYEENYFEFKSDGTMEWIEIEGTESEIGTGTYKIIDKLLLMEVHFDGETDSIAWTIESITNSSLVLLNENSSGMNKTTIQYTFSKIK